MLCFIRERMAVPLCRKGNLLQKILDLSSAPIWLVAKESTKVSVKRRSTLSGLPLREVFMCEPFSFYLFLHSSEECTCIPNMNTLNTLTDIPHAHTTDRTADKHTAQCDVLMPKWLCEAKVTQSHSFIPIIPCVGWVRGLLMASTLQKGKYCLNMDSRDSHSPAPCIKSKAHSLYNSSTWLIRPWQNPWGRH